MSFEAKLDRRADLYEAGAEVSDTGEVSVSWSLKRSGLACRLEIVRAEALGTPAGTVVRIEGVCLLPAGTSLAAGGRNKLVVDGTDYIVTTVVDRGRFVEAGVAAET